MLRASYEIKISVEGMFLELDIGYHIKVNRCKMNKFHSLGLKIKTNLFALISEDPGRSETLSLRTIINRTMLSETKSPTAQDLNSLSNYTYESIPTCFRLEEYILKYLINADKTKNYWKMLKVLNILDFVLATGSEGIHTVFVQGNAKCILKFIYSTISGESDLIEKIRYKVSVVLDMLENGDAWFKRRSEYQSIKQEILSPISRHSFESGISPNVNNRTSYDFLVSPNGQKRSSFEALGLTRPSLSLSLDRIDE